MFSVQGLGVQYGLVRKLVSFFHVPFYCTVTVLLEYLDPAIYSCLVFAL